MKIKLKKTIIFSFVVLFFLIVILAFYANWVIRSSLPITSGQIKTSSISNKIEITFDKMGIPQVWAQNENDAMFALGWLHANDRLFQMELTKRVAQGRLSEIFGDITLDFDRSQRRIGHLKMAKNDIPDLKEKDKKLLQSFVDGINAWVQTVEYLPFEFILLGLEFEKWKIEDCISILSFQTWFSDALQNNDALFNEVYEELGAEKARELFLSYPDWGKKTIPQPEEILSHNSNLNPVSQSILYNLFYAGNKPATMSHSSNAWAVAPKKSKSGKALFASDPHLDITRLPQFWYFVGIHTTDSQLNVLGITTPGLPVIVMGHNGETAWAFTAGGVDVTDIYHEKINPEDQNQYLLNESWNNFEIREELIFSNQSENPDTLIIKSNQHGPVIYENDSLNLAYTFKWAGFDKSLAKAVEAGFNLSQIKSFSDFRSQVVNFGALDANWMYADRLGNIGYQLGTPVPIRTTFDHNIPLPGWEEGNDWQGYYSLDKTPNILNPGKGWLATSNNKPDESNLEYELYGNFAYDRIMRISDLLASKDQFSDSDFEGFQMDWTSSYLLRWKREISILLKKQDQIDLSKKIEKWDGDCDINSEQAALVEYWLFLFRKYTFEDELGKVYGSIKFNNLAPENIDDASQWFDDVTTEDKIENRSDIALKALKKAIELVQNKKWGELQSVTMAHPLAQVPVLSGLLNLQRGPFARGGTAGTLNASFNVMTEDNFKVFVGPSWRFIIDFAKVDEATIVIPSGQSGHPLSSHFFDFYPLWVKGDRWTVPISKKNVHKNAVSTVTFIPNGINEDN